MNNLLHLAKVVSNDDPENKNRVRISLLNRPDDAALEVWARVVQPYASDHAGIAFRPEIDDEVVVVFDRATTSEPIVLGSLVNGAHEPPAPSGTMGTGHAQMIKTAAGHEITFHEGSGGGIALRTKDGHKIEIDDGDNTVRLAAKNGASITVDATGRIQLDATIIDLNAAQINMNSSQINVDTAMLNCSGIIQSDTIITNSVISSSYTPGAGNIW